MPSTQPQSKTTPTLIPEPNFTVRLLRGPKPPIEWTHADLRSAWRRAHALIDLHGATVSTDTPGVLVVNAEIYYGGKRSR
jgi:hypothetical protein